MNVATQTPAVVQWNASSTDLASLDEVPLEKLASVHTLDISRNRLLTLKQLSRLPFLSSLNASHNGLTAVLDYETEEAEDTGAVETVTTVARSQLTKADLSHNDIKRLRGLQGHGHLCTLLLSHNSLVEVAGLSSLTSLTHLDLRHNSLTSMRGLAGLPSLTHLHLDGNALTRLSHLDGMVQLRTLTVSRNELENLEGVQGAALLSSLDVSDNNLGTLYDLEPLMELSLLGELAVADNPFALRTQHARLRVVFRLQTLAALDGTPVSAAEKVRARNLHGADVEERQATFHAVLPDQMFTDTLPHIDLGEESSRREAAQLDRLAGVLAAEAFEDGAAELAALVEPSTHAGSASAEGGSE